MSGRVTTAPLGCGFLGIRRHLLGGGFRTVGGSSLAVARPARTRDEADSCLCYGQCVLGSRLVQVSAVMEIERPSISWMSFRSAPAAWIRVAAPRLRSWSRIGGRPISS